MWFKTFSSIFFIKHGLIVLILNLALILKTSPEIVSSFKTLGLVGDQSSASNSTFALKFWKSKIYKGKWVADFFGGPPKIKRGT